MTFYLNMAVIWLLLFILFVIVAHVIHKVLWIITGKIDEPFSWAKLPAFIGKFILPEFGGLLVLAVFMFIRPTELPKEYGDLLTWIQIGLFGVVALTVATRHVYGIAALYGIKRNTSG